MRQLVGSKCSLCQQPVGSILDGFICEECSNPVHANCARQHVSPSDSQKCPTCGVVRPSRQPLDDLAFIQRVKQRLHPKPYPRVWEFPGASFELLLVQRKWFALGRYALAAYRWDSSRDGPAQLQAARREVGNVLRTIPMLVQVGLYLVFFGPRSEWADQVNLMPADQTGIHLVIIQAVHFIDPVLGHRELNQSKWGPIRFGGVDSVAHLLDSIDENATA